MYCHCDPNNDSQHLFDMLLTTQPYSEPEPQHDASTEPEPELQSVYRSSVNKIEYERILKKLSIYDSEYITRLELNAIRNDLPENVAAGDLDAIFKTLTKFCNLIRQSNGLTVPVNELANIISEQYEEMPILFIMALQSIVEECVKPKLHVRVVNVNKLREIYKFFEKYMPKYIQGVPINNMIQVIVNLEHPLSGSNC